MGIFLECSASNCYANVSDGTTALTSDFPAVNLNEWTHMTAVVDRTANRLYVYKNGVLSGSQANISGIGSLSSGTSASIGNNDSNLYPLKGFIDDVRVYNRALSASEVLQLYNMGR